MEEARGRRFAELLAEYGADSVWTDAEGTDVTVRRAPRLEVRERDSIAAATGIPARRLPARKSVLERIRSSPDGWLWIETDRGEIRAWDVFNERGYYMGHVASPVPIEKEPFPIFGRGTVTGVTTDELGVQYVVRLRLRR